MIGHIKLDRKILDWEWYQDVNTCRLFIHLLLIANHKDGKWKGIDIKRGQLVTGRIELSKDVHLSEMQIRTCLNKLKVTKEITIKPSNKNSLITICKYDTYQSFKNENNQQNNQEAIQQLSNNYPTSNQQVTTNNNDNNDNKEIKKENNKLIYLPVSENFNGLPEIRIGAIVEYLKIAKQKDITGGEVSGLWQVFKVQNLTGKKPYKNEDDVYGHFFNWVKDKKFENGTNKAKVGCVGKTIEFDKP